MQKSLASILNLSVLLKKKKKNIFISPYIYIYKKVHSASAYGLGVLFFLVIVGYGPAVLAFFPLSILSSFVFFLSPQTRFGLTTMLSTGPLTRL